jgi:predicted enzyme related to lactoylglutathione lyase
MRAFASFRFIRQIGGTNMAASQGRFAWYELMTTDTAAAKAFYGKVVGWGTQVPPTSLPGMEYTLFTSGDIPAAGLMNQPEEAKRMGAPPSWLGYVAVDDVDATAEKVKRLGGAVHVPPMDIPGICRFTVLADPLMATFAVLKFANPSQGEPAQGALGHTGWHELHSTDWQKVFTFYSELFGWQKAEAMDMGAMGTYQLFTAGGPAIGGMFNSPAAGQHPFWIYYFNVRGAEEAAARVTAGGGKIIHGLTQVPGGSFIVQCADPQGAMFALVGPRNETAVPA